MVSVELEGSIRDVTVLYSTTIIVILSQTHSHLVVSGTYPL